MPHRIFFTNLGYARGIDGTIRSHLRGARLHFNCPPEVQMRALEELKVLLHTHEADLVCLAELDAGSSNNRNFDQLRFLKDQHFLHGHATNKYGKAEAARVTVSRGKSNGFIARREMAHAYKYLSHGTKRLVCQLELEEGVSVWFGHFSLRPWVRQKQFAELASWLQGEKGEILILGDFNNYRGVGELHALTGGAGLRLLSPPAPTFRFGGYRASVDLCLATPGLVERCHVHVVPQKFSDHDALLVEMR